MGGSTIGIVIPVRNGVGLIDRCLHGVLAEAEEVGAEVIVVDDRSSDGTAVRAANLTTVLHNEGTPGPYAARNVGWRSTDAETLVFTDVRCAPRRGWLRRLVEGLDDPGVAIVGGDVLFQTGRGLGARYLAASQPFTGAVYNANDFLPFVSTVNLATRRSILETVGGFQELRSGGDVRFSWDVQLAGLGGIHYRQDALMDAIPRDRLVSVARQWWRFGAESVRLRDEYRARDRSDAVAVIGDRPCSQEQPRSTWGTTVRLAYVVVSGTYYVAARSRQMADFVSRTVRHDGKRREAQR